MTTRETVDATTLSVRKVAPRLASEVVIRNHYLHRKPSISHAYGLYTGDDLMGVVTYGTPASRHLQIGVCPSDPSRVLELNRLWVDDALGRNAESWFVSRTLRLIPPSIVVSYADTKEGHRGYVYRALNFHYAGWTDMDRKTPRNDYLPIDPTKHTREASRSGVSAKVPRRPKVKYWTTTGSRSDKRALDRMVEWPILSWEKYPPPSQHVQLKNPVDVRAKTPPRNQ